MKVQDMADATIGQVGPVDRRGGPRLHVPMRIIAGELRSRKIQPPPDSKTTRPMPDRVREAIFNFLRGHVAGERVIDLFAGTGSMGLEAVSRGAAECVFVEKDRRMARLLGENLRALGVADRCELIQADVLGAALASRLPPAHLIFCDPPYRHMEDPDARRRVLDQLRRLVPLIDPGGFITLRTPSPLLEKAPTPETDGRIPEADLTIPGADGPETHIYGSMAVHLYAPRREPSED